MKLATTSLLFVFLTVTFAYPQNTPFQHVIVVIQENRTPDNLFGSDAFALEHQLPGADLAQEGRCYKVAHSTVPLRSMNLGNTCDPDHTHQPAWIDTYNGGAMDGACKSLTIGCDHRNYPEYAYVQSSDVVPYFKIAEQYGYANYMFQTNQGPSFPAHQFLISGTSAPIYSALIYDEGNTNQYWQWFAAENGPPGAAYGCTSNTVILEVNPSGQESAGFNSGYPCYYHNTLATLLDPNISWRYYSHAASGSVATGLWTAPNSIAGICDPSGGSCIGTDWTDDVESVFPNAPGYPNSFSPILTDLGADPDQPQCTLPAVSWVIPDGGWSDHGGENPHGAGPSWVSAIVNAVGGYDNSNRKLATNCGYWANTVILITWDDWGGWYDHVLPWNCTAGPNGTCSGYNNGQNGVGGEYVYGFRVPLMVVSPYTPKGYISGALPKPGEVQPYIHDFGSILNFIEYNFGKDQQSLGEIYPQYHYADYYAPDGPAVYPPSLYSLSDFFPSFTNPRKFTPFTQGIKYATQCFITPKIQGCFGSNFMPSNPDSDGVNHD